MLRLKKFAFFCSIALISTPSFSAAFQLAEHSASGLGRAFAGEAAIAEDASVVARNPALMSQFEHDVFTVSGIYIKPDVSLQGLAAPDGVSVGELDQESIAPEAFVPAMYYVKPLSENIAIGFGSFSNFGLSTEFAEDYAAGQLAGETGIITVNLNASMSYKLNSQWTLGAGINAVYAEATLTRHMGKIGSFPPALQPAPETEAANMEGDDIAFGWNAGVTYDINKNHRIGLSYRSEVDLDFEGEYSNELPTYLGGLGGDSIDGSLAIALPAIAELSGLHRVNDKLDLHYSVLWTGWSSFDKLEAYAADSGELLFSKTENFSNSMKVAMGGTYQYSNKLKVRAGIAYDESPTDDSHMSISIPDNNRIWYSAGVNYELDNTSSVDFGVSYIDGEAESFTETDDIGQEWRFKSEGNATLVGLQYNQKF